MDNRNVKLVSELDKNIRSSYNDIFGPIKNKEGLMCLKYTSPIDTFVDEEIRGILKLGYDTEEADEILLSSMLNSIFTQSNMVFVLSQRSFLSLVREDINKPQITISSRRYASFKCKLHQIGYLSTLKESTHCKGGVYKIIHPKIVDILLKRKGDVFFKTQEEVVLGFYDSGLTYKKPKTAQEVWDDIKKAKNE